eukprot:11396766-Alexandrium_andersonii.AAC.1
MPTPIPGIRTQRVGALRIQRALRSTQSTLWADATKSPGLTGILRSSPRAVPLGGRQTSIM